VSTVSREDAYKLLGVRPPFNEQELRRAFKALAKVHHPDKGGDQDTFVRLRAAYEMLEPDCGKAVEVVGWTVEGVRVDTLGKGLKTSARKCNGCSGKGYESQPMITSCPDCSRRWWTLQGQQCAQCRGIGFISAEPRYWVCRSCNGTGEIALFNPLFVKGGLTQKERKRRAGG
jgi:DnaJ-class molecular chaperone